MTILLREGLEALLVVVAVMAFLREAKRTGVLPYVHAGWIVALTTGGLTWVVVTHLAGLSDINREMTKGLSAIFVAVVPLGVGMWMHQKSLADRRQAYMKQKLPLTLNKHSAIVLSMLSFVTVYHEAFEAVPFYTALWNEGNNIYPLAGLGSGITILTAIAVVLLRSSTRLSIRQFFAFSSTLVAVLAVMLVDKGVVALQKVGFLHITPILMPRIDMLGIYPSVQTVLAQVTILLIITNVITYNMRSASNEA